MVPWDPDGAGPQPEQVVVVGTFTVAGDQRVDNLAAYDPMTQQWSALGTGVPAAAAVLVRGGATAGQLVVGTSQGVWGWNGATWQAFGSLGSVRRLMELANGDLVAAGAFGVVGTMANCALARWDGVQWHPLGDPLLPFGVGSVAGMCEMPNGDLVVSGLFTQIGGVACNNIARWDGVQWQAFGNGPAVPLGTLVVVAAGELLAVGSFGVGIGTCARWNGTSWVALPAGMPSGASPLRPYGANGVLFLAPDGLWVQDPNGWSLLVSWPTTSGVGCVAFPANGDVLVGGLFQTFAGGVALRVAHRRSGVWGSAGAGATGALRVFPAAGGGFYGSGSFTLGGVVTNGLAYCDGSTWTPLPMATYAVDLVECRDGSILTSNSSALLHWQNGVATILLAPMGASVVAMASFADGALVAVASTTNAITVLYWDGASFQALPFAVVGQLADLVGLPNGDVVLAGSFSSPATNALLHWDGQQLSVMPGAPDGATCLRVGANGDLFVGGVLSAPFTGIARWDGSAWFPLGALSTNLVLSIDTLPNGDVVVAERVSQFPSLTRIQRWDGTQWTQLGEAKGMASTVWSSSGTLAVYGDFARVDDTVSALFAQLATSCPAGAQMLGGGCSGGAGPLVTHLEQRAWLGAEVRTATRGVLPNALAIGVFGTGTVQQPLAQLLPIGGAGCTLRARPDVLLSLPIVNGEPVAQWTLPSTPTLLGVSFAQQTVVLETAAGAPAALVAADGVQWTVGSF